MADAQLTPQVEWLPRLVRWLATLCVFAVPLRIVAGGFLPGDDVLRHVAKAVTGRDWRDVLVLRPDVTMDSHPGWHALLGVLHRLTHATAPDLAVLSVVGLFVLVSLPPLLRLRRPEAWLGALLVVGLTEPVVLARLFLGRPFLVSLALLLTLCLLAPREDARVRLRHLLSLTAAFGVVAWIHPSWHLYLLPILACLLARRWRTALALAIALGGGVVLAGLLYGHPVEFIDQSVRHTYLALGSSAPPATLVFEFTPGDGALPFLLVIAAVLLWRKAFDASYRPDLGGPVFVLALIGWLLGFGVSRFWTDWGAPAALVWFARELEGWFEAHAPAGARARLALAGALSVVAFVVLTADIRGRWTPLRHPFAVLAAPAAREALPASGGTLYTAERALFFDLYYRLPNAPWRYIVGYEAGLMPPEDLRTMQQVLTSRSAEAFAPWVRKMRPEDRLIMQGGESPPPVDDLEWMRVGTIWSGRVPAIPGR